jgi:hypothetical protein
MNVALPLQGYEHAFAVLAALSCVLAAGIIGLLVYLYKKRVF